MSVADFDPRDESSWYFGNISRDETNIMLMSEMDSGVFLVRDSSTIKGDFVLCVKEDSKVSHYIVNKISVDGTTKYRIGDQEFADLPSLLAFYKTHYLDTTSLVRVAPKSIFKVIAKFNFPGRDPEDLPFNKGEILTVVRKDEDQWWTARNCHGTEGSVPVPYLEKYSEPEKAAKLPEKPEYTIPGTIPNGKKQPKVPCYAKVILQRIPSAYDTTALKLEVDNVVKVTAMNINGTWEGEIDGKSGNFPFNYVRLIDDQEDQVDN